jgi:serine/threonine-protein kinase
VGTVVVTPGQPCQFSDVGIREETVDGVPVVCQRRTDGSYAWDRPAG